MAWGEEWDFDSPEVRDYFGDYGPLSKRTVYTRTNFLCGRSYTVTRKWEVSDQMGNKDSCKQVVTVLDATPPTLFPAADKVVECGDAWRFDTPTAIDSGDGSELAVAPVSIVTNQAAAGLVTATCTWETTDACGNKAQGSQTVTIVDTTPPTILCEPDKSVAWQAEWNFDVAFAQDACSGGAIPLQSASTVTNHLCGRTFSATRTWVATDAAGNRAVNSQTITLRDEQPPTISCAGNKTVEAGISWGFDLPVASDDSGEPVILSIINTTTNAVFGGAGIVTRVWRASDACGNVATCSQVVTMQDTLAPVFPAAPAGRAYNCFPDLPAPEVLSASDAGDGLLPVLCITRTNGVCPTFITHTWIAMDSAGNVASVSQTNSVFVRAPRVISTPTDQLACIGQRVTLCLELADTCAVTYEWRKNGELIPGANGACLNFESVSADDAGTYCVRVLGDFCSDGGVLERCATLAVRPELAAPPLPDLTACLGESATFNAPQGGLGPFRYAWLKNGNLIAGETNTFLTVAAAGFDAGGIYTVEISGPCSSQTASGTLTVRPLTEATPLTSLTRRVGESATFSISVSGPAPHARIWRWNGIVIPGATGDTLSFGPVALADAGAYSVEIIGPCNSVTRSATLDVLNTPPSISSLSDRVVEHNSSTEEIPFTIGDAESLAADLAVTATSSDPTLLPAAYIVLGGSGANRTVTVLAPPAGIGVATVTLSVSDGNAATETSFNITLTQPRRRLTIITSGEGEVVPNLDGQALILGQSYSVRAKPASGQMFTGWSGGAQGEAQTLTFVMTSNLVLEAGFAANPYLKVRSAYNGLFHEADEVQHDTSCFFTLSMTSQGKYTGSLRVGGRRLRFNGKFDEKGNATNFVRRSRMSPLRLEMHIGTGEHPDQVLGHVTDGAWSAALLADRASFHARTNPAPFAGRYTMLFPGCPINPFAPAGDGFAAMRVGSNGVVTVSASLADGTKFVQRVPLSRHGDWPLYAGLYRGKGSLLSWQAFADRPTDDVHGRVSWVRPPQTGAAFFRAGFSIDCEAIGSRYAVPRANGGSVLNFSEGVVAFTGGGMSEFANAIGITPAGKVINHSSNPLKLGIVKSNGLFSGIVADPITGKQIRFKGAVLQKQNRGAGFCLGAEHGGRVALGPRP